MDHSEFLSADTNNIKETRPSRFNYPKFRVQHNLQAATSILLFPSRPVHSQDLSCRGIMSSEPAVGDKRSAPDAPDAYDDNCQERGKGATAAVSPAGQKLADISSNAVAPPPPPPSPAPPPQPPPLPAEEERKRQEDEASKRQKDKASKRQEDEASKRQGREAARPATSNAAAAGKDGVDAASALGRKMKKKGGDENGPGISHLRAGLRVSPILSLCPVAACALFL